MKNKLLYKQQEEEQAEGRRGRKKNQAVTLNDISPRWAWRLQHMPSSSISLDRLKWYYEIVHPSKCVVGEAYGFSSYYTYTCKDCGEIGFKLMLCFIMNSQKKLEDNKQNFVKHWKEMHTR